MTKVKGVRILVFGLVQGVFFRHEAKSQVEKWDLKGFVRNTNNGRVEIVAEGEEGNLKELIVWCQKGPPLAQVDKVEVKWQDATGQFSKFEIR